MMEIASDGPGIDAFSRMLGQSFGIALVGIIWWICTPAIVRFFVSLRARKGMPLTAARLRFLRLIGPGLIVIGAVYLALLVSVL